jgi:hypothetical protein
MKAGLHGRESHGLNFLMRAEMNRLLLIFAATAFAASPSTANSYVPARLPAAAAQCRGTDRAITKQIKFARGRTTTVIKDTVKLCTSHEYHLRARQGQTMSIHLATGKRTSFSLMTPSGDTSATPTASRTGLASYRTTANTPSSSARTPPPHTRSK